MVARLSSFALLSLFAMACSSSTGPSLDPAESNCNTVCSKAHDCGSANVNVDSCTNNCKSKSSDMSYEDKVKTCSDCVAGKACSEAAKCTGDCLGALISS